jgi:hypothetical protein
MEVKSPFGDREKGNIDILKKLQLETFPLIACIDYSGFECSVRGASKNNAEYQENGKYL